MLVVIMRSRRQELIKFLALLFLNKQEIFLFKKPYRTSILSSHIFIQGILNVNQRQFLELFHMEKHIYFYFFLRLYAV